MPFCEIALEGRPGDLAAIENDAPARGPQHAGQAVEERAFARAVGPDNGAKLSAGSFEVDLR